MSEGQGNVMPVEALKRFADDLKSGNDPSGSRFLEINLKRVDDFINKAPDVDLDLDVQVTSEDVDNDLLGGIKLEQAKIKAQLDARSPEEKAAFRKSYRRQRGYYEYDGFEKGTQNGTSASNLISLQNHAEFSSALGVRSRFGEGDGSFIDRWIITPSKQPVETKVPLMGDTLPTFTGYKRHVNTFRHGSDKAADKFRTIKSYAERRKDRLAREKAEKEAKERKHGHGHKEGHGEQPVGTMISDTFDESWIAQQSPHSNEDEEGDSTTSSPVKAYLTLPELSERDKEAYFGTKARVTFFDFYKQLTRAQEHLVSGDAEGFIESDEDYESDSEEEEALRDSSKKAVFADDDTATAGSTNDKTRSGLKLPEINTKKEDNKAQSTGDDSLYDEQEDDKEGKQEGPAEPMENGKLYRAHQSTKKPDLLDDVLFFDSRTSNPGSFRPSSARSRFIAATVADGITPKPALVIRKAITSILCLKSQHMGDKVAKHLAKSLKVMPYLQHLDISDNALTDEGLSAIIKQLRKCPNLVGVNLSRNKIDIKAATELGVYLPSENCRLDELILQSADVDDYEASQFVLAIGERNVITKLNLSRNLLGAAENRAAIDDLYPTGAGTLATLLRNPSCSLQELILSWNMIRVSGQPLALALKENSSLTSLDLSYNGLGNDGAELLGLALHYNTALRRINLTQNKIMARATFVICNGVYACFTVRELILADNPIGEVGLRSVTALQSTYTQEELYIDMRGCSFKIPDKSCVFDPKHLANKYSLDLSVPFQHAVLYELHRQVSVNDDVSFGEYSLDGIEKKFEVRTREKKSRNPDAVTPETKDVGKGDDKHEDNKGSTDEGSTTAGEIKAATEVKAESEVGEESVEAKEQAVMSKEDTLHSPTDGSAEPLIEPLENPTTPPESSEDSTPISPGASVPAHFTIQELAEDIDKAMQVFEDADLDKSGGLDQQELARLLKSMGLDNAPRIVKEILEQYDVDGGGVVEEGEFKDFLTHVHLADMRKRTLEHTSRFLIDELDGHNAKAKEYVIPNEGIVECTVNVGDVVPDFIDAVSAESIDSMLSNASSSADSYTLIEASISTMRLEFNEARKVFKALFKESGDKIQALAKVLPCCATTTDCKTLMNYVQLSSVEEVCKLKREMRDRYRILMQQYNGWYNLHLEREADREVLSKLYEMAIGAKDIRRRSDLGDVSQHQDGLSFRNIILNGQPMIIDDDFMHKLPVNGKLQFDYIYLHDIAAREMDRAISDVRIYKLMSLLNLFEQASTPTLRDCGKKDTFMSKIRKYEHEGRVSSKGLGTRFWEWSEEGAHIYSVSSTLLYTPETLRYRSSYLYEAEVMGVSETEASQGTDNTMTGDIGHRVDSEEYEGLLNVFLNHLSLINRNGCHPAVVAVRYMEAICEALAGRYLTCAQLALLVQCLPHGDQSLESRVVMGEAETVETKTVEAVDADADASAGATSATSTDNNGGDDGDNNAAQVPDMVKQAIQKQLATGSSEAIDTKKLEKAAQEAAAADANAAEGTTSEGEGGDGGGDNGEEEEESREKVAPDYADYGYSTARVEMIVVLYSQLVDKVNMNTILRFVSKEEVAILVVRLGFLNVFNTLKPEGFWSLDLSRFEEKQYFRSVILLSHAEPGQNFQKAHFQPSFEDAVDWSWQLPLSWFKESGLPKTGIVSFRYVSKKSTFNQDLAGQGLQGGEAKEVAVEEDEEFQPNFTLRAMFTSTCMAAPYAADAGKIKKITLTNAENAIEDLGWNLTFRT